MVLHFNKPYLKQLYKRSPTDIVEPLFICLDEVEIRKRLSSVEDIINNQVNIGNVDALALGIIVLFAPRHAACEITEKVVKLYIRIARKLSRRMESTLCIVISTMIDAYFDDEEEFRRMMRMMRENISVESVERFVSLDIFKKDLEEADAKLVEADARIKELEDEIADLKRQIKNSK